MNSREIVKRTIAFDYPERVARSFGDSDLRFVFCTTKTHATAWSEIRPDYWERIDEWGNIWSRIDSSSKGEVSKGVLSSIDDIDSYQFPDFSKPEDYDAVREERRQYPEKWLIG